MGNNRFNQELGSIGGQSPINLTSNQTLIEVDTLQDIENFENEIYESEIENNFPFGLQEKELNPDPQNHSQDEIDQDIDYESEIKLRKSELGDAACLGGDLDFSGYI